MSKFYIFLLFSIFLSCNSEPNTVPINLMDLEGKWLFDQNSNYVSIEFNKSNTCLIGEIADGDTSLTYEIYEVNADVITLRNEGILNDVSINNNDISLKLTDENNESFLLSGAKDQNLVENSMINDSFTKSWNIDNISGQSLDSLGEKIHIFFSVNGSYYVHDFYKPENTVSRFWKWYEIDNNIWCSSVVSEFECEDESNYVRIDSISDDYMRLSQIPPDLTYELSALE